MCRLYSTVCVLFRGPLVFPRIKALYTLYLIFSCLSFPHLSLFFLCHIYFAWKPNFLSFPISLAAREKEEERQREEELQKERERVLLERRRKEEENQFIKQVRGKWTVSLLLLFIVVFLSTVVAISFICLNVWLTLPNCFVFRGRKNKKWKGRGKKEKRRLVSVTRLNLIPQYWTKTDWWRSCYWIIFTHEIENLNTISSLNNRYKR